MNSHGAPTYLLLKLVLVSGIRHKADGAGRLHILHHLSRVCLALGTNNPTPEMIDVALQTPTSDGRISAISPTSEQQSPADTVTDPVFRANFPPEQQVNRLVLAALVAHEKLCTDDMTLAQLTSTVRDDITTSGGHPTAPVTQSLQSLMLRGKVQCRSNSRGVDTYAPVSTKTSPQMTHHPQRTDPHTTFSEETRGLDPRPPPDDLSLGAPSAGREHPTDLC